jgi:hypothetical protein
MKLEYEYADQLISPMCQEGTNKDISTNDRFSAIVAGHGRHFDRLVRSSNLPQEIGNRNRADRQVRPNLGHFLTRAKLHKSGHRTTLQKRGNHEADPARGIEHSVYVICWRS